MAPKIQPLINPSLPIEIISEILSRLPVYDLTRFKTVCKPWFNLITSLYFSHQHFTSQPPHYDDRIVVFVGKDGCLYFSNLDVSDSFTPTKITIDDYIFKDIVGSCNGLILCACNNNNNNDNDNDSNNNDNDNDDDSDDEDSKRVSLVIVNPSTMQHKLISANEVAASCGTHCYGFGYDFKEDDYKVVRIAKESTKSDLEKQSVNTKRTILLRGCEIRVYSLKSDSWRTIDQDFDGGFYFALSDVLVNNHMLHWLFYVFNGCVIRSFDVCTEQWSEVALPGFDLRGCPVNVMVFDDRLCLLTYEERSVYMMDEYGVRDSWVKLFDCPREIHCDNILPYPLIYSKSGSEILVVVGSRLFWYDSTKEICREVQGHDVFYFSARWVARLVMCTRSLVCLPGCGSIS